jgi:hypothetical protein
MQAKKITDRGFFSPWHLTMVAALLSSKRIQWLLMSFFQC